MARQRKRQANGAPWHRKFDDCWYATIDGKRTKLRDQTGQPIKGKDFRQQADLAATRVKLQVEPVAASGDVLEATVGSAYLDQWCDEYNEPLWGAVGRGGKRRCT